MTLTLGGTITLSEALLAEPFGCLLEFVHPEDPHCPVAKPHHEEAVVRLNKLFPIAMHSVDATALDGRTLREYRVFSTPTLLWIRQESPAAKPQTLTRHVGTASADKIYADMEAVLDELLPD